MAFTGPIDLPPAAKAFVTATKIAIVRHSTVPSNPSTLFEVATNVFDLVTGAEISNDTTQVSYETSQEVAVLPDVVRAYCLSFTDAASIDTGKANAFVEGDTIYTVFVEKLNSDPTNKYVVTVSSFDLLTGGALVQSEDTTVRFEVSLEVAPLDAEILNYALCGVMP